MERRDFLKGTAYCGLALAFGGPLTPLSAFAAENPKARRAWEGRYRHEFLDTRGDA